jgi:hypothetical protein
MENPSPPLPRWWKRLPVRLSLRALMILVLVIGGGLGWKANRARTQLWSVEAIRSSKGSVFYDFQYTGDEVSPQPFTRNKEPSAPKWLRNALGDEYFQEVTRVDLSGAMSDDAVAAIQKLDHLVTLVIRDASKFGGNFTALVSLPRLRDVALTGPQIDDMVLAQLAKIPRLRGLTLSNTSLTDAGLAHLSAARGLQRLAFFGDTGVSDAGMTSLAALPDLKEVAIFGAPKLTDLGLKNLGPRLAELETLALQRTAITAEGMVCLEDCRKLKSLSLDVKLSDAGFAHFRYMDSLASLVAGSTIVTDEGLAALRGLKRLRSLSLFRAEIFGPGLANLEGLDQLESLMLAGTKMTDGGLESIRKMKGLKAVSLQGTQVSPQAVSALQAARPSLKIVTGPAAPVRAAPVPTASPALR